MTIPLEQRFPGISSHSSTPSTCATGGGVMMTTTTGSNDSPSTIPTDRPKYKISQDDLEKFDLLRRKHKGNSASERKVIMPSNDAGTAKTDQDGKLQRHVSFFPQVRVRKTIHRRTFSKEELGAYWFTRREIRAMRRQYEEEEEEEEESEDEYDENEDEEEESEDEYDETESDSDACETENTE